MSQALTRRPGPSPTTLPRVRSLGLADVPGSFVTRAAETLNLTFDGIPGDRHFGRTFKAGPRHTDVPRGTLLANTRSLSIVSVEELQTIAAALEVGQLDPRWLGANLMLEGIDALTQLAPGTRLVFPSGARVVVEGENDPCRKAGKAVAEGLGLADVERRFVKAALHLRGVVGWVEAEGQLAVGDGVIVKRRS